MASVAASEDGTLATADADGLVRFWDVERREQVGPVQPSGPSVGAEVVFDGHGALVSIGSDIRFWDVSGWGEAGTRLYSHPGAVTALAVDREGIVASGDRRGAIRLWNSARARPLRDALRGHRGAVTALAFSPEGVLASGGHDGTVRLWDTSTGEELREPLESHDGTVTSLAFGLDGVTLAGGYGQGDHATWQRGDPIHVWDIMTGAVTQRLAIGFKGGVASVAFSPQGLFASAGADFLAFWPVDTWLSRKLIEDPRLGPYTAVAFSADGKTLASSADQFARGDDRPVALWSMPSGEQIREPLDAGRTTAEAKSFRALSFNPDGTLLAGAGDGIQLWDVELHQPIGGRLGSSPASSIALSADGRSVIAGHSDGAVRAYPATVEGWLNSVCDVVSRNLTEAEWDFFVGPDTPYEATCPQYPPG